MQTSGGRRAALPRKPLCLNRETELGAVRDLRRRAVDAGEPLLLAVSGGNGIGKSTLIVTVAYEFGAEYRDVVYAAADSSEPGNAPGSADLLADLLVQLGLPWQELPEPGLRLSVLRSLIGGRPLLIVLDEIRSAGQVLPLLGDLHNAAVVVAGERHLEQLRLEGFESLKLKGFDPDAGAEYLVSLAGAEVARSDPEVLRRLVVLCGGVPRLIAAAAARLADGDEPIEAYVERLERAHSVDEVAEDLSIDNVSVVNAVCDAGYEGLTSDEARAYRVLSRYPGAAFDAEAAAAVLDVSLPKAKRLIRELADRSLVQPRGAGYLEFPHVIRRHAVERALAVDSVSDMRIHALRTVEWCTRRAVQLALSISGRPIAATEPGRLFQECEPRYRGDTGFEHASAELAARWTTFVEAARLARELGRWSEAVTLPMALWPFAYHTYRTGEIIDLYRNLWDLADRSDTEWEAADDIGCCWQLARDLGALHERRGELDSARSWFDRAAAIDYLPGRASVLEWRGIVLEQLGQPEEALAEYDAAQAALEWLPEPADRDRSTALLRMHRGRALVALERGPEAEAQVRAAEAFFAARPTDAGNTARCRVLLGDIARQRGDTTDARRYWESELDNLARFGMRNEVATVHGKLADLADDEGRTEDARRHRESQQVLRPGS